MKKLLIGLLVLGSVSSFADECKIHIDYQSMEGLPSASKLASKVEKSTRKLGQHVVRDINKANVGIRLRYTHIQLNDLMVFKGPYPSYSQPQFRLGVKAMIFKDGKLVSAKKIDTVEPKDLAEILLEESDCK